MTAVPCPRCGTLAPYAPENPWRPFCRERCKSIDLGAWASEEYKLAGPPLEPQDESVDGKQST